MKWVRFILICALILLTASGVSLAAGNVELTESERAFIQKHPVIYLGVDPKFIPYEFIDSDGKYKGIASEYIQLINRRTGLRMEVVPNLTWTEAYERGVQKKLDVLPCVSKTEERQRYFLYSNPYYSFERVIVVKSDNQRIKSFDDLLNTTVAVQKNSSHHSYLLAYPAITLSLYTTVEEALHAVADGREQAFVGNFATSSYLIKSNGITGLKFIKLDSSDQPQLYFAVRNDWPELVSIINKGLMSITEEEKISINNHWIGVSQTADYTNIIRAIGIAGAVIGIVLLVSVFWIVRLKREVAARIKMEAALQAAKDEAEMANQFKSTFLARMSHEIRTPLHAITGMAYLMKKTDITVTQRVYLDKITQASRNMLGIINDVLDFSKIEAGRIQIENVPFNLDRVLQNVINIVSFKIEEQGIDFVMNKDTDIPTYFLGDPVRIEQILLNVLSNAVKFTHDGSVSLSIRLVARVKDTYTVEFSVKDTGIGMSDEQRSHLFQPFDQGDSSITRRFGGTGLGLSITKHLLEMMGGEINVYSALDEGSTFNIRLTLEADRSREYEEQKKSASVYFKNLRVLVVDQNTSHSAMLGEYLRSFNIVADTAASEARALQVVQMASDTECKPYNLLIVDNDTPLEGGIAFCARIKALPSVKEIPKFILMIPFSREDLFEKLEAAGLDFGISKPIIPSILYDGIVELFRFRVLEAHDSAALAEKPSTFSVQYPAHVLIVEDNRTNQFIAQSILEQSGFKVSLADNGKEGYEFFAAHHTDVDLVLMDLHMPIMNGFESSALIKQINPDAVIVAMTADAITGVQDRCSAVGIDYYISKPFDPDQFVQTIWQVIKPRQESPITVASQPEAIPGATAQPPTVTAPVLDEADGIRRMGGKTDLYLRVLEAFYDESSDTPSRLREALDRQDHAEAGRLVHKVKGSAGNIGAKSLYKTAAELQKALEHDNTEEIACLHETFQQLISRLLEEIRQKLTAP